jgi:hypothetical protein
LRIGSMTNAPSGILRHGVDVAACVCSSSVFMNDRNQ